MPGERARAMFPRVRAMPMSYRAMALAVAACTAVRAQPEGAGAVGFESQRVADPPARGVPAPWTSSPDGKLAVKVQGLTVRLHDRRTGKPFGPLLRHKEPPFREGTWAV